LERSVLVDKESQARVLPRNHDALLVRKRAQFVPENLQFGAFVQARPLELPLANVFKEFLLIRCKRCQSFLCFLEGLLCEDLLLSLVLLLLSLLYLASLRGGSSSGRVFSSRLLFEIDKFALLSSILRLAALALG